EQERLPALFAGKATEAVHVAVAAAGVDLVLIDGGSFDHAVRQVRAPQLFAVLNVEAEDGAGRFLPILAEELVIGIEGDVGIADADVDAIAAHVGRAPHRQVHARLPLHIAGAGVEAEDRRLAFVDFFQAIHAGADVDALADDGGRRGETQQALGTWKAPRRKA